MTFNVSRHSYVNNCNKNFKYFLGYLNREINKKTNEKIKIKNISAEE